eukprot:jgi/Botrbrau1/14604/Bobra.67_2s0004.1
MVSMAPSLTSRFLLLLTFACNVFGDYKSEASEWKYPYPPWIFPGEAWSFFGTKPINGTHPPDFVPDPDITFVTGATIQLSSFTVLRFPNTFWGPWDALVIIGSSARAGNGPIEGRITQAFSSAVAPTQPYFPDNVPFRLAKFDWTSRPDGAKDLKIYSPPSSPTPIASFTGLFTIPFLCVPLPTGILTALGLTSYLQSITDSYDPVGPITGHTLGNLDVSACTTAAVYTSIEAAPPVSLDGGFFNLGVYFNGTFDFVVRPYP